MKLFNKKTSELLLVVSDLHIGKGKFFETGQMNILEDFDEDERFVEFVEHYTTGDYYNEPVHLVLNGDIFNIIQIDYKGAFTHVITEERAVHALKECMNGHPKFMQALKKFANSKNKKLTYIIGNHDAPMDWEGCKRTLCQYLGVDIVVDFDVNIHGVHIEHGHRFEAINNVPKSQYYVDGPTGQKVTNLPWGSLFCILALPVLKKERPFIDRVRPISSYVKWCLFHDFSFFLRMAQVTLTYFIKTRIDPHIRPSRNLKTTLKILKQITIYPRYEKQAKRILKRNDDIHTVVMGHTHLVEWRRFPEGKLYFNCGTWNQIPSMDAGLHQSDTSLTYVAIVLDTEHRKVHNASINVWKGTWRPFYEEISLVR